LGHGYLSHFTASAAALGMTKAPGVANRSPARVPTSYRPGQAAHNSHLATAVCAPIEGILSRKMLYLPMRRMNDASIVLIQDKKRRARIQASAK
jgi:hypothetical protein